MQLDNKGRFKLRQMYRLQTMCCSMPCQCNYYRKRASSWWF